MIREICETVAKPVIRSKAASVNYIAVVVLATYKTCGAFP